MKYYNKHNKQNILPLKKNLTVQDVYGQKSDDRFEIRLPHQLKKLIDQTSRLKDRSKSDLTMRLWLDYLAKTGSIIGKIENPTKQFLAADVEDFLKRA
jgi:hypothetical protein